jgi:alkylation response protein AidB-like acyl-CoA dehydrogenase
MTVEITNVQTRFSEQDLKFQQDVRAFLTDNYTAELSARLQTPETYKAAIIEWQKVLHRKGWIAPGWPVEHGGTDWSDTQKFIFDNERADLGIPGSNPFGLKMVGPTIYTFGSEDQKAQFLPRILASDDWWCQGYSEPGAGSDLAALSTRAVRDGDEYVVNGAKIWTTNAHHADWIFCLVRTDTQTSRRQQGISFLLIDMTTPGITVNPIISIDGRHTLNEVAFSDVRVPVPNCIGEENQGWTYAKALLAHERTAIAGVADSKRELSLVKEHAGREMMNGRPMLEDADFQYRLAAIETELMALEYTELRVLATISGGGSPGAESSILKIKGTEVQQSIQTLMMDVAGVYGATLGAGLAPDVVGHDFGDAARDRYMYGRASTIYGGSNEVQKNIIAKAILGL